MRNRNSETSSKVVDLKDKQVKEAPRRPEAVKAEVTAKDAEPESINEAAERQTKLNPD